MISSIYGGTGFIGSRYCEMYPDEVYKIDREKRQPEQRDLIYFISTVDNYNVWNDLQIDINTNLKVFCEVLEHCKSGAHVINFISSWFVYGKQNLPVSEDASCDPKGFYSITKRAAEQLLISFCETYGVHYRILRLCNVYGKNDNKASKKKNALQYMINKMKNGEDIELYEDGLCIRDMMHVDDVCRAINLLIKCAPVNDIYNIGSGEPTLIRNVITLAKEELKSKSNITSIPTPPFHKIVQARDFYMNIDKLKHYGFKQQVSLYKGVKSLCH